MAGGVGSPEWEARRMRAMNIDRQKAIVSDTNRLVKLANELDAEINSTNPDSLTPEQLRKVAEIEKLARSVKEKMRTPVEQPPMFHPETPPPLMR
jgi:hypothetical protein